MVDAVPGSPTRGDPGPEPVRYEVDLAERDRHLVRVTIHLPADLATAARLVLSVWTPGSYVVRDYARHVQRAWAHDEEGGALPLGHDAPNVWRLPDDHVGPARVVLELYANDLSVRTNHVDDHHALLIPAATFPSVDGAHDRPHLVRLRGVTEGHRVFSLLPDAPSPSSGADRWFVAEDRDHLVDAAFEVGDLPHHDLEVSGVVHRLVWAGHGGRPDLERLGRDLTAIAEATRELFDGELPIERYTVLIAGWDEGGGGLEHRDGAVLQVPVRTFQDDDLYARLQALLAHEYLHLWNVKRLVPVPLLEPAYDRPTYCESLWVAEGWTAYYDDLLPVRAGCWEPERLLTTLSRTHEQVARSPATGLQSLRQASVEAWVKHYVPDENRPNAVADYYAHGSLVALELDLRLRAADPGGRGLDEVLGLLWRRHGRGGGGYTEQDVLRAVSDVGGTGLARLVDHRVGVAGPPELEDVLATVGLAFEDEEGPHAPQLGVEATDAADGVVLASVLRDGPAWRAGLTGRDRLVAIDGRTVGPGRLTTTLLAHEPDDEVEVTVARGPRLLTRTVRLGAPRPARRLRPVADPGPAQARAFARWTGASLPER